MRRVRLALDRQDAQARGHLINRDDRAGVKLVCMLVAAGIPLKWSIMIAESTKTAGSTFAILSGRGVDMSGHRPPSRFRWFVSVDHS